MTQTFFTPNFSVVRIPFHRALISLEVLSHFVWSSYGFFPQTAEESTSRIPLVRLRTVKMTFLVATSGKIDVNPRSFRLKKDNWCRHPAPPMLEFGKCLDSFWMRTPQKVFVHTHFD
ncbi:MAG: hypothetical protein D4R77_02205 [Planctomycetaceae bacterium]|nr:MAG: hypothetical protein D4R77_02205 [Planctomycetaceae bacterium]